MSQAPVSSAFRRVPQNPNQISQSTNPPVDSQPQPTASTAPAVPPVAPEQATSSASAPAPAPMPAPVYGVDPDAYNAVAQERDQLRQALDNLTQERDQLYQDRHELERIRREQEAQQAISAQAFENLGSVDVEDAQAISRAVLTAAQKPLEDLRADIAAQRAALEAAQKRTTQDMFNMRRNALNAEILRAHPDFPTLQNTPEYKQFMSQRDGLSSKTRDQRAAEEYMAGNTAFVIDMLNRMKGSKPNVEQVMTVAPVQSSSGAVGAPAASGASTPYTLSELNSLYQMRRISHDEYREQLKKLRESQGISSPRI